MDSKDVHPWNAFSSILDTVVGILTHLIIVFSSYFPHSITSVPSGIMTSSPSL